VVREIVVLGDAFEDARTGFCAISKNDDDAITAVTNDTNKYFLAEDN
jgi:hypothetical protein